MNKIIVPVIVFVAIAFGVGFFVGQEYTKYRISSEISKAISNIGAPTSAQASSTIPPTKKVYANIGDDVELSTLKFKINSSEEAQTIVGSFGSPKTADNGTKFVIVDLTVVNTTKESFDMRDGDFTLTDQSDRKYDPFNSIGSIKNYIDMRTLAPNIAQAGKIVYNIPTDSTSYSLSIGKSGTNEVYIVKLK